MRLPAGLKLPGGFRTLRQTFAIRDYRLYSIGNFSSNTGLWVQRVAIGWLAWELTHSPSWLGIIAFADQAATLLLALFAGALTDRMSYLKLLRITQSLSLFYSVSMAALTFAGWMDIWVLLAFTLLRGTIVTFGRPSRLSVVFHLVGRDLLPTAISFNSLSFNLSRFIGPAIGGALIVAGGTGWAFAVGALFYLIFTVTLRLMRFVPPPEPAADRARGSLAADVGIGLRYIAGHPGIRIQMVILLVTSLCARPLTDLLPGFAAAVFGTGAEGLALLQIAHGIGAMTAGGLMLGRGKLAGLTKLTIVNILIMALAMLAFAASEVIWIAVLFSAIIGYALVVQSTGNQMLIQSATDPDLRGRVISVYGLVARGGPSVGALIMGVAADHFGLQAPVAAGAVLCLALWLWAWRRRSLMAASLETEPAGGGRKPRGD